MVDCNVASNLLPMSPDFCYLCLRLLSVMQDLTPRPLECHERRVTAVNLAPRVMGWGLRPPPSLTAQPVT
jgi:hypothetical protein